MLKQLTEQLKSLSGKENVDENLLKEFIEKFNCTDPITRDQGATKHFCNFYIPIDRTKKTLYLVIHKKSGLWMPPGGHLDSGETMEECVKRECKEELSMQLTNEKIQIYNISTTNIDNPLQPQCKLHYDVWFTVDMKQREFDYNKDESGDGGWFTLEEALKTITFPSFIKMLAPITF